MLKEPESMDELVYYTDRILDNGGEIKVWVFKKECPKCHKALMSKPKDKKGKVKVRAKYYVCPNCGYTISADEYEKSLEANVIYTCPKCKFHDEIQVPFIRKKIKGVLTFVVKCKNCGNKIYVTKKFKQI